MAMSVVGSETQAHRRTRYSARNANKGSTWVA
jgi:hypothetical protein